jgi:hypothetical protein
MPEHKHLPDGLGIGEAREVVDEVFDLLAQEREDEHDDA